MPRRIEGAVCAILSIAVLVPGAWLAFGPEPRLAHLFYDDAFYYLQVARNLAAGVGSTFDGIYPTNGYHPLWCWILVPVFYAISDPGLAMRVSAGLWFLIAAAIPPAMWWVVRPRSGAWAGLIAAALTIHPFLVLHLQRPSGLETPLFALLLLLFAGAYERGLNPWALGLLLGALVLARVDAGLFAVAAALLLVISRKPRALAAVALAAMIVAGPALAWNTLRFGSPMPISGRVVRAYEAQEVRARGGSWSPGHLAHRLRVAGEEIPVLMGRYAVAGTPAARWIERSGVAGGVVLLGLAAALVTFALRRRAAAGPVVTDALALLAAGTAIHFAIYAGWFWAGGEEQLFRLYYFMPEGLLLAAACGAVAGPLLDRRLPLAWSLGTAGVAILYLVLGCRASFAHAPGDREPMARHHLYGWVRTHLPEDAVLGMLGSGRLGYFSGRPVVNLDGLINGTAFLEALRRDDVDGFLFRSPVTHVVTHRESLMGFDPERPETPPSPRSDMGEVLYRLAARHGCGLRTVPGSPDSTVVVEIDRP